MKRLLRWGIVVLAAMLIALPLLWFFPSHRANEPAPLPTATRTPTAVPTATLTPSPTIPPTPTADPNPLFSFGVVSDQRSYTGPGLVDTKAFFRGAVEGLKEQGGIDFILSPGDMDPPENTLWTIEQVLGTGFPFYPVMGNHELPGGGEEASWAANMQWLAAYDLPGEVSPGPAACPNTTYSFDIQDTHFVVLNEYCSADGPGTTDGDIPDQLYQWLAADLASTSQPNIFVTGHEPAYPQADAENGASAHMGDSLNAYPAHRDRFWALLNQQHVIAYFQGHTHKYSAVQIDGVWQIDSGHARGIADLTALSTFLVVRVYADHVTLQAFRMDEVGVYQPRAEIRLK